MSNNRYVKIETKDLQKCVSATEFELPSLEIVYTL